MTAGRWSGDIPAGHDRSASLRPGIDSEADQRSLLVAVGGGDRQAFTGLYRQLAPVVHGLVRRVVRDPAQAEEVTQEVFVEVWRLAPRYDPDRGTARSWVMTIAHRRAVDRVRSAEAARNRDHVETEQRELTEPAGTENVEGLLNRQLIRDALGSLAAPHRRAIELAYYGGHTYREVAVLLDTPEGTVKSHIREGLSRLRDRLGGP